MLNTKQEVNDRVGKNLAEVHTLPVIPHYNKNQFTDCGQPQFNMIYDPQWPRRYYLDSELEQMRKDKLPYEVAHHLYADGPIVIQNQEGYKGI